MAIKILLGGSPCTHWSIAQKNNRETEPSGMGWELFKNYLIAKEKFKPDLFLYENNKSAAQAIKDQIAHELGVGSDPMTRFTYINSALVSAQNRQRFYVTNFGDIEQPEDRGVLLKDILERGVPCRNEKAYCLDANYFKGGNLSNFNKQSGQRLQVAEPVACRVRGRKDSNGDGYARYECRNDLKSNTLDTNTTNGSMIAEPVGTTNGGKSFALTAYYSTGQNAPNTLTKSKGSMAAEPVSMCYKRNDDGKSNTLSTVLKDNPICKPVRIGCYPSPDGTLKNSQGMRLYSIEGKSVNLTANGGGMGAKTGLYAVPVGVAQRTRETEHGKHKIFEARTDEKSNAMTTVQTDCMVAVPSDKPIYEVRNGLITIKGKQYPIKLSDGYYIIRKLTVKECCRLQTMPDDYCKAVSATQGYKGLGNGWTAEIIIHLLNHALKDVPRNEELVVLSLYDGIGTGRYCLDKMGFTNIKYHAYEIDKFPMAIANDNYPDIVQHGDAFAVREDLQIKIGG